MRHLIWLFLLTGTAHAQYQAGSWVKLDYTYNDVDFKTVNSFAEKGQFAGVRGEVGLNLLGFLAVSAGGDYSDGHMNYDGNSLTGTPIKHITADYMRDLRAMAHLVLSPIVISGGIAERYWYNNLEVAYKRRTTYRYLPFQISYFHRNMYLTIEQDLWQLGKNRSTLSDLSASEHDVDFTLGKGQGFGVELGYFIPSALGATHLFARYHKWNVKASNTQYDGAVDVTEPESNTTLLQAGIGIGF